jgi:hypothetical protein
MNIQELIDLIVGLANINANPPTRGSIFEKLLIKCLCNANKSLTIENITLQGKNVKIINISFKNSPIIVEFGKKEMPNIWEPDRNYLYIPKDFNYPLFDFFLVTKIDTEPCLICCSATIQSTSDHFRRDKQDGKEKRAAALQLYNFYKENKLSKIIEVFFIPIPKLGSNSHSFVALNQLIIDEVYLNKQFEKLMPFFLYKA